MSTETVLVTGASSGIGRELVRQFAASGARMVLVSRSAESLHQLAKELRTEFGTESIVLPTDLSVPNASEELFDRMQTQGLQIDVLVNNAGIGKLGLFHEISFAWQSQMVQLNVQSLMQLTRLLLPGMVERRTGAVLNVSSTAAFQPGPHAAIYFASKAFVLHFSEAIREELLGSGVTVTVLCPGPVPTNFFKHSQQDRNRLRGITQMSAVAVAKAGYRGLRRKRRLVIPGLMNNLLVWSVRCFPRPWVAFLTKRLHPLPNE